MPASTVGHDARVAIRHVFDARAERADGLDRRRAEGPKADLDLEASVAPVQHRVFGAARGRRVRAGRQGHGRRAGDWRPWRGRARRRGGRARGGGSRSAQQEHGAPRRERSDTHRSAGDAASSYPSLGTRVMQSVGTRHADASVPPRPRRAARHPVVVRRPVRPHAAHRGSNARRAAAGDGCRGAHGGGGARRLAAERARRAEQIVAPVRVAGAAAARRLALRRPARECARLDGRDHAARTAPALRLSGRGSRRSIVLPPLPLGYHRVRVALSVDRRTRAGRRATADRRPAALSDPARAAGVGRVYGVLANLYSVRSASNWGVGDLSDLARLVELVGGRRRGVRRRQPAARARQPRRSDQPVQPGEPTVPQRALPRRDRGAGVARAGARAAAGGSRRRTCSAGCAAPSGSTTPRSARASGQPSSRCTASSPRATATAARRAARRTGAIWRSRASRCSPSPPSPRCRSISNGAASARGAAGRRRTAIRARPAVRRVSRRRRREAIDLHCYLQFELDRQLGVVADAARAARAADRRLPGSRPRLLAARQRRLGLSRSVPRPRRRRRAARRLLADRAELATAGDRPTRAAPPPATTTGSGCCARHCATPARCASTT